MKIIETEEIPKFKPVTVVFESQAEIDYITTLLGASGQNVADHVDITITTYKLFNQFLLVASEEIDRRSDKIEISTK